jgi:hypothetical protein
LLVGSPSTAAVGDALRISSAVPQSCVCTCLCVCVWVGVGEQVENVNKIISFTCQKSFVFASSCCCPLLCPFGGVVGLDGKHARPLVLRGELTHSCTRCGARHAARLVLGADEHVISLSSHADGPGVATTKKNQQEVGSLWGRCWKGWWAVGGLAVSRLPTSQDGGSQRDEALCGACRDGELRASLPC